MYEEGSALDNFVQGVFIVQIIVTCFLLWFVVRKARAELKKTVEGNGQSIDFSSYEESKTIDNSIIQMDIQI
ncbi:hypothetical protein ScPMuIL_000579 [Solemya velum]